jgi:hypothetical protein
MTYSESPHPSLCLVFFSESAAEFYEAAVDYLLGYDILTERDHTQVSVFYVSDEELHTTLLEAALRMGGDEVPTVQQ